MKKLLLVLTVCAFFVACNEGATTETEAPVADTTTTTVSHDTTVVAPAVSDTSVVAPADTTHH